MLRILAVVPDTGYRIPRDLGRSYEARARRRGGWSPLFSAYEAKPKILIATGGRSREGLSRSKVYPSVGQGDGRELLYVTCRINPIAILIGILGAFLFHC